MSAIRTCRAGHPGAARAFALSALVLLACSEPTAPIAANLSAATTPPAALGWQEQARILIAANRFSTLAAERVYAVLSVAQYAALDSADTKEYSDGTIPDDGFGPGGRARFELERGAVTGVSWLVLVYFFPSAAPALEQRMLDEAASRGAMHPSFQLGLGIGVHMANVMIARTQNDRFTVPFTGTIPVGPGLWIPNGPPVGATGGNVLPFLLSSGSQFRSPPPPAFNSPAFLADLAEIKTLSDTRTTEQVAIAKFWAYPAGTFTSAGHWNQLAGNYITQYQLNERAATHVFALLHATQFDANVVACFDSKYTYNYIRPVQADPTITLAITMPNHPSYPSGHSCASGAAATVLAHFFPDRAAELNAQMTEAGLSRMYGGLHYRFDITAGQTLGRAVALNAISIDQTQGILSVIF